MTGIEKHWREQEHEDRQRNIVQLQNLRYSIAPQLQMIMTLESELYPLSLQGNAGMAGMGLFGMSGLNLMGALGASALTGNSL